MNQHNSDANKKIKPMPCEDSRHDLSIYDIQSFIVSHYKTILIFGLLGFAFSIFYLSTTPKKYQAVAQIAMAQIGVSSNGKFSSSSANVEEPSLLIFRLSNPSGITTSVDQACGNEDQTAAGNIFPVKPFKLIIPNGVANVVELKTFGATSKLARNCAQALTDYIQATQAEIAEQFLKEVKLKLAYDEDRLAKVKNSASPDSGAKSDLGISYLYGRDEASFLLEEISTLKNMIISAQNRSARLIAPIYVEEITIPRKKLILIIAGLVAGLFFGALFALIKKAISGAVRG